MNTLDDPKKFRKTDKSDMAGLVGRFPEMMEDALKISPQGSLTIQEGIKNIVIAGMGGSAISGDITAKLLEDKADIPVSVIRNYDLPEYAGPSSLVFVLSYSGNTEETLSAFEQASKKKASIISVTSGGALKERSASNKIPMFLIPSGLPPRASMPYLLVPVLRALSICKMMPDIDPQIEEAVSVLKAMRSKLDTGNVFEKNPAKQAASKLKGKFPLIFGTPSGSGVSAFRWKTQLSENSKTTSVCNTFPELDHNEIVNLGELKKGKNNYCLVLLRNGADSERMVLRINATKNIVSKGIDEIIEVPSEGDGRLSRMLSLCYFGDWVSVYLAVLNGTDPTPVHSIDRLKKELSA
ncbi:MAG: bifunctional phosphoglucose/phosphomannose isomerase [Candidatus Saganbacteria bacterium]|nr:bifunctional phosphoglucose/phosphomannose isomerase [Candidatus Saganbacteria bacterium]